MIIAADKEGKKLTETVIHAALKAEGLNVLNECNAVLALMQKHEITKRDEPENSEEEPGETEEG